MKNCDIVPVVLYRRIIPWYYTTLRINNTGIILYNTSAQSCSLRTAWIAQPFFSMLSPHFFIFHTWERKKTIFGPNLANPTSWAMVNQIIASAWRVTMRSLLQLAACAIIGLSAKSVHALLASSMRDFSPHESRQKIQPNIQCSPHRRSSLS